MQEDPEEHEEQDEQEPDDEAELSPVAINSWTRLEPRCHDVDVARGLRAELHDPAWLIARQWQLGELDGHDGGTPIGVEPYGRISPTTQWRAGKGPGSWSHYILGEPLDALVEPTGQPGDLLETLRSGRRFERLLRRFGGDDALVDHFRDRLPLGRQTPDEDRMVEVLAQSSDVALAADVSVGWQRSVQGRVIDGVELARIAATGEGYDQLVEGLSQQQIAIVEQAAEWWYEWWSPDRGRGPRGGWSDQHLSYDVGVRTLGDDQLEASYCGDELGWTDFTLIQQGPVPTDEPATARPAMPSPARFSGLIPDRWWRQADPGLDATTIETNPEDLTQVLLREVVLRASDRLLVAPLPVPLGSLCLFTHCEVIDTFGYRQVLDPAHDHRWQALETTQSAADDPGPTRLYLPPVADLPLDAEPHERIHLLVDHSANLAWALEELVATSLGQPRRRPDQRPDDDPGNADTPTYHLRTPVPAAWFPLVPTDSGQLELRTLQDQPERGQPRSRILAEDFATDRASVPDLGVRVETRWRLARGTDGSRHVWQSRRRRRRADARAPGLAFDQTRPL